jgi:trans-aconitate methyltransferase
MRGDLERSRTWDGAGYSRETTHHRAFDEWFLERHPPVSTDHIIDVGCGSGEFTARVAEVVSEGGVIGIDPDQSMLSSAARHVRSNLEFRHGHAAAVFELLEQTGFEIPIEGVRTVAQRRAFDRDQLVGFLRTQAALAYVADASDAVRDAFLRAVVARIDELRQQDGSYDQTFVRLEVLARRPT